MDRLAHRGAGGLHDGLGERGVRVHGVDDLLLGGLELLGHDEFGDQLGRLGADEVGAQEFAVLGVEDQLHEALGLVGGLGSAAGDERELADADLVPRLTRGLLGQADAGDARVGVGASGDDRIVDRALVPGEGLDAGDRLMVGDVGQPRRADDVADGVEALEVRLEAVVAVDLDVVLLDRHVELVVEQALDVARDADRDQQLLAFELLHALRRLDLDDHAAGGLGDLGGLRLREDGHPALGEGLFEGARDLLILAGEDAVHHLDDGDLGADGVVEVAEFQADRAGADDHHRLGLGR